MELQARWHAFQVWSLSFWLLWWGSIVHLIQGLNTSAVQRVLTWIPRAFEPYHDPCMNCGCIFSLTSSPWVPYFMCSCVPLSPGRLGSARAEVGVGFAVVGWFRRVVLPPLRWSFSVSVCLRFSFSLPFQGLPVVGQVSLCWCFLFPSALRSPLRVLAN